YLTRKLEQPPNHAADLAQNLPGVSSLQRISRGDESPRPVERSSPGPHPSLAASLAGDEQILLDLAGPVTSIALVVLPGHRDDLERPTDEARRRKEVRELAITDPVTVGFELVPVIAAVEVRQDDRAGAGAADQRGQRLEKVIFA